ncbi:MAG: EXPERA domain-containing protein [Nitrososphaerales archaeon]
MNRRPIPLSQRRGDIAILAFFLVNILFITYVVDIEQLIIPDPAHFNYPTWPPPPAVDAIHWWGRTFDQVLLARPVWWKMTIWIDVLFFGPFYVAAIYCFVKGRDWIRIPSIIYASTLLTNVVIILGEEAHGLHATPNFPAVFAANLPWLLFPILIIYRMGRSPTPFSAPAGRPLTGGPLPYGGPGLPKGARR